MAKAQVFKDEQRGVNYVIGANGERLYLEPKQVVDGRLTYLDPNHQGSFVTNKEWDAHAGAYKSKRNWNNIVSLGALAAIGAPAVVAAAGAGAGGAAVGAAGTGAGTGVAPVAATSGFWSPSTLKLMELGVGTGMNIYANRSAANASREQGTRDDAAAAKALAFLQHQDELDRQQYAEERARLWGNEDVDRARREEDRQLGLRREGEREARLAPLRGGSGAFATLNDLAGLRPSNRGGGGSASAPPVRASDWDGTYSTSQGPSEINDGPRGGIGGGVTAADDDHLYTMPDGSTVPYIPFHNPYAAGGGFRGPDGQPFQTSGNDGRPVSTTQPVGRRPPMTLAELAGMRA